jgi:nucleoid DNA-binding protein
MGKWRHRADEESEMDRRSFVQRVTSRSGTSFDETNRVLDAVLAELCSATAGRQRIDFGEFGSFEAEPGTARARFVPGSALEVYGWQRRRA